MNFVPLIPYLSAVATLFSALALLLAVYVRVHTRRQIERMHKELTPDTALAEDVDKLGRQLERLAARVDEIDQRHGPSFEWVPEPASLNLNRRGHVLRLYRRGDSIPQIAAALGLSQGEVELMVKVQEMTAAPAGATPDT
jgi:DNA-binding NarL/FixJ family response regulator